MPTTCKGQCRVSCTERKKKNMKKNMKKKRERQETHLCGIQLLQDQLAGEGHGGDHEGAQRIKEDLLFLGVVPNGASHQASCTQHDST